MRAMSAQCHAVLSTSSLSSMGSDGLKMVRGQRSDSGPGGDGYKERDVWAS